GGAGNRVDWWRDQFGESAKRRVKANHSGAAANRRLVSQGTAIAPDRPARNGRAVPLAPWDGGVAKSRASCFGGDTSPGIRLVLSILGGGSIAGRGRECGRGGQARQG